MHKEYTEQIWRREWESLPRLSENSIGTTDCGVSPFNCGDLAFSDLDLGFRPFASVFGFFYRTGAGPSDSAQGLTQGRRARPGDFVGQSHVGHRTYRGRGL